MSTRSVADAIYELEPEVAPALAEISPETVRQWYESAGFTLVLSGAKHEVYCNGKERIWVKRPEVDRSLATSLSRCPDCRCSAFAPAEGVQR